MIRVAVLSPSSELGGAERSLLTFLELAQGRLVDAVAILPRDGPLVGKLSDLRVPCRVVPLPGPLLLRSQSSNWRLADLALLYHGSAYLVKLAGVLRRLSPQVLYANGIKANLASALLGRPLRMGVVWHLREHWCGPLAGRIAQSGAHAVIANSQSTANRLRPYLRPPARIRVIYNAVDAVEFSPHGDAADAGPAGEGILRIGLPGAFAGIKGHQLLLAAAPRILSAFPSARFYFIGGGFYDTVRDRGREEQIRRRTAEMGLSASVVFTGFQDRMAPWYRAMDVVVNASIQPEGFGRTLLEAMACGRAVVGPDAGGVPEFVQQGVNGLLYPMGDAEALADRLLTLLRDPALRRRLGEAGRETAKTRFAPLPHAQAIARVLAGAAGAPAEHRREDSRRS